MSFVAIAFFYLFGGNILLTWGVIPSGRRTSSIVVVPILLVTSAVAALLDGAVFRLLLTPWGLESMAPFAFALILVGALALVRLVSKGVKGGWMTTIEESILNYSLVLYVAAMASSGSFASTWKLLAGGAAAALGYMAATAFLEAIMDRLDLEPVPAAFKGGPIRLISAGLMAMAFSGIDAVFFSRMTLH